MQPDSRDVDLLRDMREYALRAQAFVTDSSRTEIEQDMMRRMAIERCLEIVGEAARGISSEFLGTQPQVEWRAIGDMRNVLVHQYDEIDVETLWRVATEEIPLLLAELETILAEYPDIPDV